MSRARILVVEDEGVVAMDLEERLRRLDYEVVGLASSGEEATAKAGELRPELVLMDIGLAGDMDGVAAADEVRRRHDIPVVYLTAHSDEATLRRATRAEPFGYVLKPVEARELETAIEVAVYKHAAIGRQRELERQLHAARTLEAVGLLAGGTAHHFNNLLTVIVARGELLRSHELATAAVREHAGHILTAASQAAGLVRQLLAFSQRQAQRLELLDLNEVIRGLGRLVDSLPPADQGPVRVALALQPGLGRVQADRAQLATVVLELTANARDAMPEGGTITIETADVQVDEADAARRAGVAPGPFVRLAVRDTGRGMDEATRARLFEPFFTTKEPGGGPGLGLATVHGIVSQSGGHVAVESAPGLGTTVLVHLPRQGAPAEAPPAGSAAPRSGRAEARPSETVLLVDDDDAVRVTVAELLQDEGYQVLQAAGAAEALCLCGERPGEIHLLLSDIVMPGMNGVELSDRVRAARPGIRVLFLSGHAPRDLLERGVLRKGMQLVTKPFDLPTLLLRLREVLEG